MVSILGVFTRIPGEFITISTRSAGNRTEAAPQDFVTSGFTEAEHRCLAEWSDGPRLFEHFRDLPGPVRIADVPACVRELGFSTDRLPSKTFQGTPMRHRGVHVGNFYLVEKEGGDAFTDRDEEILVLFASQAATAIANARAYRAERRARADLEALIETSPVGVVVLDVVTGLLLPVWDRLPKEDLRVRRLQTDDSDSLIGRVLNPEQATALRRAFGLGAGALPSAAEVHEALTRRGAPFSLANGWRLVRRRLMGTERMEIEGPVDTDLAALKRLGCVTEIVSWRTRVFVPGAQAVERLLSCYPLDRGSAQAAPSFAYRRRADPDPFNFRPRRPPWRPPARCPTIPSSRSVRSTRRQGHARHCSTRKFDLPLMERSPTTTHTTPPFATTQQPRKRKYANHARSGSDHRALDRRPVREIPFRVPLISTYIKRPKERP